MKSSRFFLRASVAAGLLVALWGCDRGPSLSEIEGRERASRLYTHAMDDLQAGRMDAAIKGFERVVLQEPKSYSAHFQLATLLQDVRKDYISAIIHYRSYLASRPASDKAPVAQDRVKLCETLLAAEIRQKVGGSGKLAEERKALLAERDALDARVRKLEGEMAKATREIARLEGENASKSRLLKKLGEADGAAGDSAKASLKEALALLEDQRSDVQRRRLKPTDAELLDDDEAGAGRAEENIRTSAEIKTLKKELADLDAESAPPSQGVESQAKDGKGKGGSLETMFGGIAKKRKSAGGAERPETYTVQEGDTLFKISTRFYGSASKWRTILHHNRATIPSDGRLRAGQVIRLP